MALDTRNRRASAIGLALASLSVLPAPASTIDQPERQQVAWVYAGVLAGEPDTAEPSVLELFGSYSGPLLLNASAGTT